MTDSIGAYDVPERVVAYDADMEVMHPAPANRESQVGNVVGNPSVRWERRAQPPPAEARGLLRYRTESIERVIRPSLDPPSLVVLASGANAGVATD